MSGELPPQIQNQLAQLQQLQQQAQAVMTQKTPDRGSDQRDRSSAKRAGEERRRRSYIQERRRTSIRADKLKLTEELKERKDMMDIRLKTMAKQEERIQGRFTQLQEQL